VANSQQYLFLVVRQQWTQDMDQHGTLNRTYIYHRTKCCRLRPILLIDLIHSSRVLCSEFEQWKLFCSFSLGSELTVVWHMQ